MISGRSLGDPPGSLRDAEIGFAPAPRGLAIRNPEAIFRIAYQLLTGMAVPYG
jgi:hypothetical protein